MCGKVCVGYCKHPTVSSEGLQGPHISGAATGNCVKMLMDGMAVF